MMLKGVKARKNKGRKQVVRRRKNPVRDDRVDLMRVGRGNMRVYSQNRGLVLPDQYTQTFLYAEQQRNIFNTAINFGTEAWAFTDLFAFRNGVSPTIISGLTNAAGTLGSEPGRMRRYRVLSVKLVARVQNREATNPVTVILHPSQILPVVSSSAEIQWLMEQQSNCVRTLGPATSGSSMQELRMKYNPEKFYGEQYHEQDEYSGAITFALGVGNLASPTTPVYLGLSFHNVNTNTLTTGGLVLTVSAKIKVLFYQPDRDEDPTTFKSPEDVLEEIEQQIATLRLRAKQLSRTKSQ